MLSKSFYRSLYSKVNAYVHAKTALFKIAALCYLIFNDTIVDCSYLAMLGIIVLVHMDSHSDAHTCKSITPKSKSNQEISNLMYS